MKDLTNPQLNELASNIRQAGSTSRTSAFQEGRTPSITDIHEAVLGKHISEEEGRGLSGAYQPDKVAGTFKRKDGKSWNKLNRHVYSDMVRQRKNSTGAYKYKNKGTTSGGV